MPVFAIIIAYVAFVLPYTSDGPIWNARIMLEAENCRKNWWLDILLLNNFYNVDEQVIGVAINRKPQIHNALKPDFP